MKKIILLFVFALIAATIAVCGGCKNTRPNPDDSAVQSELLPISQTQPPSESLTLDTSQPSQPSQTQESQKKTIFYIDYAIGNYNMLVQAGVTQAGKDLECDYVLQRVPYNDIEGWIQMLENAIASRADAIIINVL